MNRRLRSLSAIAVCATVALGVGAGSADAAVTLGETFVPNSGCGTPTTGFGTTSPTTTPFAAPAAAVVTSWSFRGAGVVPALIRFKVGRGTPASLTTVGRSAAEIPVANQLNTYATRVPIQAGDVIGMFAGGNAGYSCGRPLVGHTTSFLNGADPELGTTALYSNTPTFEIPLSATLEPDADSDGYGDESQDLCPSDADTQAACRDTTPPETAITKKPAKKSKSKKATFEFSSSEPNSTFKCSLDGVVFESCTSPKSYKVKTGRHSFTVLAKDAAGNVDDSPATASWTVKKKKKRR